MVDKPGKLFEQLGPTKLELINSVRLFRND